MSSTPIPIRYYYLINDGVAFAIYPEIRAPGSGTKIWDGRNYDRYTINAGGSLNVDLKVVDMDPGTQFILAESTLRGQNMQDNSQVFSYDPNSSVTATAVRRGDVDSGSLDYTGISST